MKRRRNAELSTVSKVAIAGVVGLAAGGLTAWWLSSTQSGSTALDVAENVRLPQPGMKMVLPETLEEFETLDEVLCEVGGPLINSAPPGTTIDEVVEQIRSGMASELYPDFPWPPVSGDHPTVSQLWTELGLIARRAVVTGNVCPAEAS